MLVRVKPDCSTSKRRPLLRVVAQTKYQYKVCRAGEKHPPAHRKWWSPKYFYNIVKK